MGGKIVNWFQTGKMPYDQRKEIESKIRKHVKYIFVSVFRRNCSRYYTKGGMRKNNRTYCFSIMTDDNKFTYYSKRIFAVDLSSRVYKDLKMHILTPFLYDHNTIVLFDDNIDRSEIVYTIFDIMRSQLRFSIRFKNTNFMCRVLARHLNVCRNWSDFGPKKQKILFDIIKDRGLLAFVPNEFMEKMSLQTNEKKTIMRNCIFALLYLYYGSIEREINERKRKRFREKHPEKYSPYSYVELYNKDMESKEGSNDEEK